MRLTLTVILGLLNLLAFGTIYYLELGQNGEPEQQRAEPVLPSSITESTRIEISGEAVPERRILTRSEEVWMLEEPVVWKANPNAIDRIFRALLFLRQDIRFTMEDIERNNQSLADYGLDSPILALTFIRDGIPISVRIGSPTDVGSRFYLLGPSGDEVFVVDEEIIRSVALDLQDLRDPYVFPMDFFSIKEMSIQPGNARNLQIRLVAIEDGWRFEAPIQTRANGAAVDSRLQQILETTVDSIQPETQISPSESGLVDPRMRLSLEDGNSRRTFILGGPVPGQEGFAYGKLEGIPTVLTIREESYLALGDALTSLREKSFFRFRVPLVTSMRVSSGPRTVTLQKLENESWQVNASGEDAESLRYPADPGVLSRTFESLITLRAVRFVSDAPSDKDLRDFGLDEPQRIVTLEGEEEHQLLLGNLNPETRLLYAKVANEPFVYAVPLQMIRSLPVSALDYRLRILDQIPESGRIRTVTVTDLDSGEVLLDRELGPDGKSWTAGELDDPSIPPKSSFVTLIRQLRTFRVESYLTSQFTDGLALEADRTIPWRYLLSAEIELPGSGDSTTEERNYYLTERVEGTLQGGGSREKETTFFLTQELIDAWADLFPPRPLPSEYQEEEAQKAAAETPPFPEEKEGQETAEPDSQTEPEPEPASTEEATESGTSPEATRDEAPKGA